MSLDLTTEEQQHVRVALRYLRVRFGGWANLAKALRFKDTTLSNVASGRAVTATMAVRMARLVKVGIDDMIGGTYPPKGSCPLCGHGAGSDNTNGVPSSGGQA